MDPENMGKWRLQNNFISKKPVIVVHSALHKEIVIQFTLYLYIGLLNKKKYIVGHNIYQ